MNETLMQYSQEEIESILQCSYYDRRTDYVWKYIMGDMQELENVLYPIPSLESFQAMHDMLKKRNMSVDAFLEDWKTSEHPGLLECHYNERSRILRIKARSFIFTYREKLKEYQFVTYANIARIIGLENRITRKKYRKGGLFSLSFLEELDEQLFSRYSEKQRVLDWRKTPQFALDVEYCESMIPFIMQDADTKCLHLGYDKRLNIILSGNDKVRIGIVENYTPEEMIAMPCYPRAEWQDGITAAFEALAKQYAAEQEAHATQMKEWSEELTQLVLKNTPFNVEQRSAKYQIDHELPESQSEDKTQQQKLLDNAIKYIIDQTAPLVAYTGPNEIIRELYKLVLNLDHNDRIRIKVSTSQWWESGTFDLEDYEAKFRVWWSQLLLSECKYAKQCALDPEHNHPLYLSF